MYNSHIYFLNNARMDFKNSPFWRENIITDSDFDEIDLSFFAKEYKRLSKNTESTQADLAWTLGDCLYKKLLEEHIRKDVWKKINAIDVSSLPVDKLLKIGKILDDTPTDNHKSINLKETLLLEESLKTPLDLLGLSSRAHRFLRSADFETLGDIYTVYTSVWRDKFRKRIYKFGETSLVEVEALLIQKWLIKQEDIKKTGE